MLHTSTEQPYPSTQHESGVQPRYQPWEQPRYKPCSGLPSTGWVHGGAGSRSILSLLQMLSRTLPGNDLLSLLLSCGLVFSLSSSLATLCCPLCMLKCGALLVVEEKHHLGMCCYWWPREPGKLTHVFVSNIRRSLAQVHCCLKVELMQFMLTHWISTICV